MAGEIYKIEVEVTRKSIMQNETSASFTEKAPTSLDNKVQNLFLKDLIDASIISKGMKTANSLISRYGAMSGNDIGQKNIEIGKSLGMTFAKALVSPQLAAFEFGGKVLDFTLENWIERRDDNIRREYLNDISGNFVNIERNTVI